MKEHLTACRKTIVSTRTNTGPTAYMPDTPQTESTELRKLSRKYHGNTNATPAKNEIVETIQMDCGRGTAEGKRIIPLTTVPFLDSQYRDIRGGRVIGGGTSKEAIRNAKKKQKGKPKKKAD